MTGLPGQKVAASASIRSGQPEGRFAEPPDRPDGQRGKQSEDHDLRDHEDGIGLGRRHRVQERYLLESLHHRHEHVEVEGKARAHRVDAAPRAGETEAVASEQGNVSLQSGAMSRLVDPYATAPAVT